MFDINDKTSNKIVRPYSSIQTSSLDFNLKEELAIVSEPHGINDPDEFLRNLNADTGHFFERESQEKSVRKMQIFATEEQQNSNMYLSDMPTV